MSAQILMNQLIRIQELEDAMLRLKKRHLELIDIVGELNSKTEEIWVAIEQLQSRVGR